MGIELTPSPVDKLGKHKLSRAVIGRGTREHRDGHNDETANGPHKGTAVDGRKNGVEKGVDDKRGQCETDVYEELVPSLRVVALSGGKARLAHYWAGRTRTFNERLRTGWRVEMMPTMSWLDRSALVATRATCEVKMEC